MQSARVGKRGAIVVPAKLRKRFGIEEGSLVIAEETEGGILIRPAMVVPIERYTPSVKRNSYYPTLSTPPTTVRPGRRFGSWALIRIRFNICDLNKWTGCFLTPTFYFLPRTRSTRGFSRSGNSGT